MATSNRRTAIKITIAASRAADMADCLACVKARALAFAKANNLLNQVGVVLPSRIR